MKLSLILTVLSLTLVACNQTTQAPAEDTAPDQTADSAMPANNATDTAEMEEDATQTYTLAEVAEHTTPNDCWLAIEGKVYDVSGFADQHGGGEAVYEGCGTDATDYYNDRSEFSGEDSPDPHSDTARSFLPNFYIGDLVDTPTE